jgi:8-oxo-dGDP phosphatase
VVSSAELARGDIVGFRTDMVRMPDGDIAGREVVEHPGAVAVLALDEADRVLLIRQYRHPVGALLWEIPAGLRDVAGEPPLATAERELLEETGYRAADWRVLADYFSSPGITSERLRIFLARGLTRVPDADRGYVPEHEEAQLVIGWLPLDAAVARFLAGDLHNGVAAVGILSAYAARKDGLAALRGPDSPERWCAER